MTFKIYRDDTDIFNANQHYVYVGAENNGTVTIPLRFEVDDLPGTATTLTMSQINQNISDPVRVMPAVADIKNGKAVFTTSLIVNCATCDRDEDVFRNMSFIAKDDDGNKVEQGSTYIAALVPNLRAYTESGKINSTVTALPAATTCNTLSVTPTVTNILNKSVTFEVISYGAVRDVSSSYAKAAADTVGTATVSMCPMFYNKRYESKYQSETQYVNLEVILKWSGLSSITGKTVTGTTVYYMRYNPVYDADIYIQSPVKVRYDDDYVNIEPDFLRDTYALHSVSTVVTGAISAVNKYYSSVKVTTAESAVDTTGTIRFTFTSTVEEPYTFYYDVDIVKQGSPDFIVFNSKDNYTLSVTGDTAWSAHVGSASASIASGKIVTFDNTGRLQLKNILSLNYPVINTGVTMNVDETNNIAWHTGAAQSHKEYRVDTEKQTFWFSPRWMAEPDDNICIILSSNKLYRNAPFFVTYNISRNNTVTNIDLTIYKIDGGSKKAVWVKNGMDIGYGVTRQTFIYWGAGESLVLEWSVTDENGTWTMTENATLSDTCNVPYIVYWSGAAGGVRQAGANSASKKKVAASFGQMTVPVYENNVTRDIKKKWKSENTVSVSCVTDYLAADEMNELSSLFTSLSTVMYDTEAMKMAPVQVSDKSFTVSTFVNNGRKYANATFNVEYAESDIDIN